MEDILQIVLDSLLKFLVLLIPILFGLLTRAAINYIKAKQLELENKNRLIESRILLRLTSLVVSSAEELFNDNNRKSTWAQLELRRIAFKSGIVLSERDAKTVIEGSLKEVKSELRYLRNGATNT